MKILLVDDSRMMRRLIRSTLEGGGFAADDILEASDGLQGLQILQQREFKIDLVLADWNMPQMDGISLLKTLRTLAPTDEVPVIMVTSQAQFGQVRGALYAGAREYVIKPFSTDILLQKVNKVLGRKLAPKSGDTAILPKAISTAGRPEPNATFLSQLPPALMAKLCRMATAAERPAGSVLIHPGEVVDSLHVVVEGSVEVLEPDAREATELRAAGDCLGELAFLSGEAADFTARARTPVRLSSLQKSRFSDLLMEFPELTYYMSRIRAHYAARRNRKVVSDLEEGLSGSLKVVPLPELVQTLRAGGKTGLLRVIREPGKGGDLYFEAGELRHVIAGNAVGEEAFYGMMGWEAGKFVFDPKGRQDKVTIHRPTMAVLVDGMRQLDESRRAAPPPGPGPD